MRSRAAIAMLLAALFSTERMARADLPPIPAARVEPLPAERIARQLRAAGIALTVSGIASAVALAIATAGWFTNAFCKPDPSHYPYDEFDCIGTGYALLGTMIGSAILTAVSLGAGLPLWIVGARRLDGAARGGQLSFGLSPVPGDRVRPSLSYTMRF